MPTVTTPISGAVAVYSDGEERVRLPVIGLDEAGTPAEPAAA